MVYVMERYPGQRARKLGPDTNELGDHITSSALVSAFSFLKLGISSRKHLLSTYCVPSTAIVSLEFSMWTGVCPSQGRIPPSVQITLFPLVNPSFCFPLVATERH